MKINQIMKKSIQFQVQFYFITLSTRHFFLMTEHNKSLVDTKYGNIEKALINLYASIGSQTNGRNIPLRYNVQNQ